MKKYFFISFVFISCFSFSQSIATDRPSAQTDNSYSLYHKAFQLESGLMYSYSNGEVNSSSLPNLLLRYGAFDIIEFRFSSDLLLSPLENIISISPIQLGTKIQIIRKDDFQLAFLSMVTFDSIYQNTLTKLVGGNSITENFGIGYTFFKGISKSKGKYLIQIPSDNSHPSKQISKIIKLANKNYDIVTTYYANNAQRSYFRNLFTLFYTPFLNFIYGTSFPYFNGITLYKTNLLKKLKFNNSSFSYQIEIFVYLHHRYNLKLKIIPTILKDRRKGSKAFRIKNSLLVLVSIIKIFFKSSYYRYLNFFHKRKD